MTIDMKKRLVMGGLAIALTFGGLAGCGDGVDQDNGPSDGEQKDQIDNDTKSEVEKNVDDSGVNDGVDQDNGITDGEEKDEVDK
jgi:hypothetical protein